MKIENTRTFIVSFVQNLTFKYNLRVRGMYLTHSKYTFIQVDLTWFQFEWIFIRRVLTFKCIWKW